MIDRGWRRSGTYCYKPDLEISCCPQYTIRLNALDFVPTKQQRKLLRRWDNYVYGERGDQKAKCKKKSEPDFLTLLHHSEAEYSAAETASHKFTVTLEESTYTPEKFALFSRYQKEIHNDTANPRGFKGFLIESPLNREPITYSTTKIGSLPKAYGSYHQLYRLDGQLIAIGVLDILPGCVSSVYFMYDKRWEKFSLGKISALREVALAREMYEAGAERAHWLYMGFYIHSCQKMRYKGEYIPSELLDPLSFEWYPLETCKRLLDQHRFAVFSNPGQSKTAREAIEQEWPDRELAKLQIIERVGSNNVLGIISAENSSFWQDGYEQKGIVEVASALGEKLCDRVLLFCN